MATEEQLNIVIKTVADTSGAQQVAQSLNQTQRAAAGVQQQLTSSQQGANAVMRALLQQHGATIETFEKAKQTVAQSTGVAPTLLPRDFGIQAQAVAEGAQKATATTRAVGESARLTGNEVARMGLAFLGVSAGLSAFTTAGMLAHRVLGEAIQDQVDLAYAARGAQAAFGQQQAEALQQAARAFQAAPDTRGTATEFLQSATALNQFAASAGMSVAQTQQLILAAGRLAAIHHTELGPALQAVVGAVSGDSDALARYGVVLTDASGRIIGLNATYAELVTTVGKARAEQLLAQTVIKDTATQAENAAPHVDELAAAMDRLGKASEGARTGLGDALKGMVTAGASAAATVLEGKGNLSAIDPTMGVATSRWEDHVAAVKADAAAQNSVTAAIETATAAVANQTQEVVQQISAFERLSLSLTQYLEVLGRLQTEQGRQATLQRALAGPAFPQAATEAQIQAVAQAQAAQEIIAQRAQRVAMQQAGAFRQQLEEAVRAAQEIGPTATAIAEAQLQAFDRLADAHRELIEAQRAQNQLQREGVMLAGEQAAIQLQFLPQQQQMLANERELQRVRLLGQRAALPSQEALEDLRFQEQRARLIARDRTQPVSERIEARRDIRQLARAEPAVELRAIEAQRAQTPVDRALARLQIEAGLQQNAMQTALAPVQAMIQQNQLLAQVVAAVVANREQTVNVIINGAIDVTSGGNGAALSDSDVQRVVDVANVQFVDQLTAGILEAERARSARLAGTG